MILATVLDDLYFPKKRSISSDSTRKHYRITVKQFSAWLGHPAELADLTDDAVDDWLTFLLHEGRLSPYTIKQRRTYILALWNWLAKRRVVERFPCVGPVKAPEIVPDAWSEQELGLLLRHCSRQRGWICGVPAGKWWLTIHTWWFYEGERIGATLSCRWEWLQDGVLVIPALARKGSTKTAVYHLHPETVAALETIRQPEREMIWPWEATESAFYHRYKKLIQSSGLAWRRGTGPHKVRRTHATLIEKYGGDASLSLMHSSSAVTRKHYIDPRIAHAEPENRKLPRIA